MGYGIYGDMRNNDFVVLGGKPYRVVTSRPTKFLGWVVMYDRTGGQEYKEVAGPFKTKLEATITMWNGSWSGVQNVMPRYVKRKFKSRIRKRYIPLFSY